MDDYKEMCAADCPPLDRGALEEKVRSEVGFDEFLFFRNGIDDADAFIDVPPFWECECSHCRKRFAMEKKRGRAMKDVRQCPVCGAEVRAARWSDRKQVQDAFSYQFFQRGHGAEVWVRSFQVTRERDLSLSFFEYARCLFFPGGARRWTRSRSWFYGESEWEEKKSVVLKRWQKQYGQTRANAWGGVELDEVRGSCIEYSQFADALAALSDPIEYLALYCKYPTCEFIWKMGLGRFFLERERNPKAFNRAINLRAKSPDKLLRGMNKAERRLLAGHNSIRLGVLLAYKRLREHGVCRADESSFWFAFALSNEDEAGRFLQIAERCGVAPKALRKYYERQERRSGIALWNVMSDHRDYLRQLSWLNVAGGELLPDDLDTAHRRLSARERKFKDIQLNGMFRARRRLWSWACYHHDGMFIRPVDSVNEITREGEQQVNCVAGYARRHAEGRTVIFVLRQSDRPRASWHTVELDPKTLTVKQCRGYRNADMSEKAREFMAFWHEYLLERAGDRLKNQIRRKSV